MILQLRRKKVVSVEAETKRALRSMVLWRLLGDVLELPPKITMGIHNIVNMICFSFSKSIHYYELEAARRYRRSRRRSRPGPGA